MDGSGINAIRDLADRGQAKTIEIDGQLYTTMPVHDPRKPDKFPDIVQLRTLQSFADLVNNLDDSEQAIAYVHVAGPASVKAMGKLGPRPFRQRIVYAEAAPNVETFHFDNFLSLEGFIIGLQQFFAPSADRDTVLRTLGSVRDEALKTHDDDGVSQSVVAKTGIVTKGEVRLPNPVNLLPFRSFPEIDPTLTPFVLRLKKDERAGGVLTAALFECDGGRWELDAVAKIKAFLGDRVNVGIGIEIIG